MRIEWFESAILFRYLLNHSKNNLVHNKTKSLLGHYIHKNQTDLVISEILRIKNRASGKWFVRRNFFIPLFA